MEGEFTHRVEWQIMSKGKMGCSGPMTEGQAKWCAYEWNESYPDLDHWVAPLPADWRETMERRYDHGMRRFTYLPE
jgi:hypothetical protein